MADYIGLPPVPKTASADSTGMNTGNYSVTFAASDFNAYVPYMEVTRLVITGGIELAEVKLYAGTQLVDSGNVGFNGITSWAPRIGLKLTPGQEFNVLFAIATSAAAPDVTLWLQYDAAIPANMAAIRGGAA